MLRLSLTLLFLQSLIVSSMQLKSQQQRQISNSLHSPLVGLQSTTFLIVFTKRLMGKIVSTMPRLVLTSATYISVSSVEWVYTKSWIHCHGNVETEDV